MRPRVGYLRIAAMLVMIAAVDARGHQEPLLPVHALAGEPLVHQVITAQHQRLQPPLALQHEGR